MSQPYNERCTRCGMFALKGTGYCDRHTPKERIKGGMFNESFEHDFGASGTHDLPDSFGIIKDKFGYEE
ncbi:hypothetical protein KAR91_84490 [Candidatus Pacearchaeota archaeon]|nr:hypothetical protein [Candidatus Pacearchaeota archaeon]